jgi:hypothetical protein
VVGLLQTGVSNHQLAVVQHDMADEVVAEMLDLRTEGLVLTAELLEGLRESVGDLDVGAAECSYELVLVVAGDAERVTRCGHAHHETKHARGVRAAVDEVADEHGLAAFRV